MRKEMFLWLIHFRWWSPLGYFLGSQLWEFISFLCVYCYICFRWFIHMPKGLLAEDIFFKANLKKQIILLPAKTAGCCIRPFPLEMSYGH